MAESNRPFVISVGNISMGGAGKTPHTIEIATEYINKGKKVAILSLGYKGQLGYGTNVISDGKKILHTPPKSSDEPYMMALNCPKAAVITGKNRKLSLDYAVEHFNTEIAVLDDAFQHHSLKKDVEILLLDHKNPISTGFPFPFGYLREFPSSIKRADIIVFTRAENYKIPEKAKKYIGDKPVFFSTPILNKVVGSNSTIMIDDLKGVKVCAFSAVASNKSFYNSLRDKGLDILSFKGFQDHKVPKETILENLIKEGKLKGAEMFITTEKDYVKLSDNLKNIFMYLKMEIEINKRDSFFTAINSRLDLSIKG